MSGALARVREALTPADAPWIEPDTLLPLSSLLSLVGERLADRLILAGTADGAELCLRPDMTLPVALAYAREGHGAVRAYRYEGRVFRAPQPGGSPSMESVTLGVERFGEADGPAVDAEVLAGALNACEAARLGPLQVKTTDLALFASVLDACPIEPAWAARLRPLAARPMALRAALAEPVPPLRPDDPARGLIGLPPEQALQAAVALVGAGEPPLRRTVVEVAERLAAKAALARSPEPPAAVRDLVEQLLRIKGSPRKVIDRRQAAFAAAGVALDDVLERSERRLDLISRLAPSVDMYVDPTFQGNFWYYDGFMFSIRGREEGGRVVASGGRYDGLVGRLTGGESTPAAGVSFFARAIEEMAL